jgi:hypothetical protein
VIRRLCDLRDHYPMTASIEASRRFPPGRADRFDPQLGAGLQVLAPFLTFAVKFNYPFFRE